MAVKHVKQVVTILLVQLLALGFSVANAQTKIIVSQVAIKHNVDQITQGNDGTNDRTDHTSHNSYQSPPLILTLQEAYILALENHEQVLIARKEISKSRLLPKKANAIMLPKVNMYGRYRQYDDDISIEPEIGALSIPGEAEVSGFNFPVKTNINGIPLPPIEAEVDSFSVPIQVNIDDFTLPPIITVPQEQAGINFQIVQPLYKGNWLPRKEQAKHSITRDKENYQQVAQDILLQVAQIYYEVVKSKELVDLSLEILRLTKEEKRVALTKFEGGAVTEDAVLNADLKITATQSKLIEYGNRLKLMQKVLKRYIGEDIGPFDVVTPPDLPVEGRNLSELVNIALRNRHDYRKINAMRDITQSELKLAKSRFYPSLESSLDYFVVDNPSYYQDTDYWIFALNMTMPLFQGGARYWDFKEKTKSIEQAELAMRDSSKNIRIEVEQALLQIETTQGILANLRKQEELAQKNYDIIFSKFKLGAASTVDLNQAITILNNTKTELIVNTFDFQVSLLRLQKVIGLLSQDIIPIQ